MNYLQSLSKTVSINDDASDILPCVASLHVDWSATIRVNSEVIRLSSFLDTKESIPMILLSAVTFLYVHFVTAKIHLYEFHICLFKLLL